MRPVRIINAVIIAAAAIFSTGANALTITWDTSGACASGYACDNSERSFLGSDGSTVVTAKAFSISKTSGATIRSASLRQDSGGLGVRKGRGDSHTVDNSGNNDFIAFYFSESVETNAVQLTSYGDTDISVWMGTVQAGVPSFSNEDLSDLDFNYGARIDNEGGEQDRTAQFGADAEFGNLLVVAALVPGNSLADFFKIKSLYAEAPAAGPLLVTEQDEGPPSDVSTPSTMLVFAPALFGMAAWRRRRMQKQGPKTR